MVCLKASETDMKELMGAAGVDSAAFHDSDLPHMEWTAVAFRPVDRCMGAGLFGNYPLA
jgi:hypothetical protein